MTMTAWTYVSYLLICIGITIWVARTLRRQGFVLLTAGRTDNLELSEALSHLLTVGFYLINLGAISYFLKVSSPVNSIEGAFETTSMKVGLILLAIGFMHFFIVGILAANRHHEDDVLNKTERRLKRHSQQVLPPDETPWEK